MQTTFFRVLGATLIAATTVQMAGAAEHHARKAHATAIQQFRDSNAYAAPRDTASQPSYLSNLAEGAQSSGPAGH
jgi:hypothetical protein